MNELVTIGLEKIGKKRGEDIGLVKQQEYWREKSKYQQKIEEIKELEE